MIIGVVEIELFIPHASSLKSKRGVVKSIKDRIRHQFNVSISEVGYQDKWQRCALAIVTVSTTQKYANQQLDKVRLFFDRVYDVQVIDSAMTFF